MLIQSRGHRFFDDHLWHSGFYRQRIYKGNCFIYHVLTAVNLDTFPICFQK
ncbi:Uncharacterized protein APZ42_000655, partial [Daphnia magna]